MRRSVVFTLVILLALAIVLPIGQSSAQAGNLLQDAGFEGNYTGRAIPPGADVSAGSINVPAAWGVWIAQTPRTEPWMNLVPTIFPHNGPDPNPQEGARALNLTRDGATFTVAVFQQVAVPVGSNVQGSAFGWVKTCRPNPATCSSEPSSGARMRVGIDPNGGTDPNDADILWSGFVSPHNQWLQMTTSATATGGTVTIFLYATQTFPAAGGGLTLNRAYWDTASLVIGGAGGAAPAAPGQPVATFTPTPPPVVAFVVPQAPQPDGSILHVVQNGDTLASIAFAYGVTVEAILELNPWLGSGRFIFPGDEILIQPAGSAPTATPEAGAAPTQEAVIIAVSPTPGEAGGGVVLPPVSGPVQPITGYPAPTQVPTQISVNRSAIVPVTRTPAPSQSGSAATEPEGSALNPPTETEVPAVALAPTEIPTTEAAPTDSETKEPAAAAAPTEQPAEPAVTEAAAVETVETAPPAAPTENIVITTVEVEPTKETLDAAGGAAPGADTTEAGQPPADSALSGQPGAPDTEAPATEENAQIAALPTNEPTVEPTTEPTAQPTSEPTEAPTTEPIVQPSATPEPPTEQPVLQTTQTATICVLLFDDANENGIHEANEPLLAGGRADLSTMPDREIIATYQTTGQDEPFCFGDLPADAGNEYVLAMYAPDGYRLTAAGQARVRPQVGEVRQLPFGAKQGAVEVAAVPPAEQAGQGTNTTGDTDTPGVQTEQLLQISGLIVLGLAGIVLVAGMGLALILRRR